MTVDPALTGHLPEAGPVPALQRMSLDATFVTGELEGTTRAHEEPKSAPSTQRAWKVACAATFWAHRAVMAAMVDDFMMLSK